MEFSVEKVYISEMYWYVIGLWSLWIITDINILTDTDVALDPFIEVLIFADESGTTWGGLYRLFVAWSIGESIIDWFMC